MSARPDILCIGSALWDVIGRAGQSLPLGADVPGRITRAPGGVALNIAMTLARLGRRPAMLTALGDDDPGLSLIAACARLGVSCDHATILPGRPTDRYMAIEGTNGLIAAIADAHTLEAAGAAILAPLSDGRLAGADAPWTGPVVLDGNLTEDLLAQIATSPLFAAARLAVAPASPGKALRLAPLLPRPNVRLYVNLAEAALLSGAPAADAASAARAMLEAGAARVLVTDGPRLAADGCARRGILTATPPAVTPVRVTGAGDTFMAAHFVAEDRGERRDAALAHALAIAAAYVAGKDA